MSQQDPNNVQLTCPSCMNVYLIQAQFQAAPHQCPHCGVMQGQPQTPLQNPALQNQQYAGANPGGGYLAAAVPPNQLGAKGKQVSIVFIVRCIVGSIALVAIIATAFYILNRGFGPVIDVGMTEESGLETLAGEFTSAPGGVFEATFKARTPSGAPARFKLDSTGHEDANLSDSGKFLWRIPSDAKIRLYEFNVICWDPNDENKKKYFSFQVDVVE